MIPAGDSYNKPVDQESLHDYKCIGVIMHSRTRTYHICPFRQDGLRSCFGSSGIAHRQAMEKQRLVSGSRAVRGCGGRRNDRRA